MSHDQFESWVPRKPGPRPGTLAPGSAAVPAPLSSTRAWPTMPLRHDGTGRVEIGDDGRVIVLGGYDG